MCCFDRLDLINAIARCCVVESKGGLGKERNIIALCFCDKFVTPISHELTNNLDTSEDCNPC